MICLPYGSERNGSKGWGGYAYINHYLQVLNNERCQRVSTMVHEFGHNLNLGKFKCFVFTQVFYPLLVRCHHFRNNGKS